MIILFAVGRRGRGGAGHFVFRNCCLIFVPKRNLLKLDPITMSLWWWWGGLMILWRQRLQVFQSVSPVEDSYHSKPCLGSALLRFEFFICKLRFGFRLWNNDYFLYITFNFFLFGFYKSNTIINGYFNLPIFLCGLILIAVIHWLFVFCNYSLCFRRTPVRYPWYIVLGLSRPLVLAGP